MNRRVWYAAVGLMLMSLVALSGYLMAGFPKTHDGQDHVARIANFSASLSEGNLVPRWAGNLNWGYGHPILMFLYPLPSYFGSAFHLAGFGIADSVKAVFIVSYVASILAMFLWARSRWGIAAGVIGALLYGFAPYRFVNLYVRGAIGEHVAFIFPPLLLWSIDRICAGISRRGIRIVRLWIFPGLAVSLTTALLVLSHNALAIMFLAVAFVYAGISIRSMDRHRIDGMLAVGGSVLLGFGMSAFFLLPALLEGKYTLRHVVMDGEFATRFVPLRAFFDPSWNYGQGDTLSKYVGLAHWIVIAVSLAVILKRRMRKEILATTTFVLCVVSLFFMTKPSEPLWHVVPFLRDFQFPWRFLSVTVLLTSILGAWLVSKALSGSSGISRLGSGRRRAMITMFIAAVAIIAPTMRMWKPVSYLSYPDSYYTGIYRSTTDTGESSPIWSVRFMEQTAKAPVEVIEGEASILQTGRSSTWRQYLIMSDSGARILENTLYFPGWNVSVDGVPALVEFQDPAYRGLITFPVPAGEHTVDIRFQKTRIRLYSEMISALSIAAATALLVYGVWRRKR